MSDRSIIDLFSEQEITMKAYPPYPNSTLTLIHTIMGFSNPEALRRWAPVAIRLIVGYGFMAHGFAKLLRGPETFTVVLHAMGLPLASLLSWATVAVEILGGLAILLGAFITLASIPMIIVLLVAIITVHLPYGFSSIKILSYDASGAHFGQPGYETDLLYVAGLVSLVISGAGPFALDNVIKRWLERRLH
jgi:putative oxidoreductase